MLSRRAPEGIDGGWDESNVTGGAWDNHGGNGKVRVRAGGNSSRGAFDRKVTLAGVSFWRWGETEECISMKRNGGMCIEEAVNTEMDIL